MTAWRWFAVVGALVLAVAACTGGGGETPSATAPPSPTAHPPLAFAEAPPVADDPHGLMALAALEDVDVVRRMGETGYQPYTPVLIELLRFPWLLDREMKKAIFSSLAQMNGRSYGDLSSEERDWAWWVEWLGRRPEVRPPSGFVTWKGDLMADLIDPEMKIFFREGVTARIRIEEIVWGGVPKDGIPDLTNPPVLAAAEADYLELTDRVFGVSINGEHRAYPLRILNAHEMANDVVGGVPIALAY